MIDHFWLNAFFTPKDKEVRDACPVCKSDFDIAYLKTERIYWCDDCEKIVQYHPGETVPRMLVKKRGSNLDAHYTPYEEDWRMDDHYPEEDYPPLE